MGNGLMAHEVASEVLRWVNVEKPTQQEMGFLEERFHFHKLDLDDCITRIQLTKIDAYKDYLFIVLHFPTSIREGIVGSSQLSIFIGRDYLVCVHQGDLLPLVDMFRKCESDLSQRDFLMGKSPGYLFYRILDALVDNLFPMLDRVMGKLEQIEDNVFDERTEAVREITELRREIATLRRILAPYRRLMGELASRVGKFTNREERRDLSAYFDDVDDHVEKIWDLLENGKETVDIYKDTDFLMSSQRTNRILSILTILFTLSIPATVVGTLYGMNVNLPGGIETGSWGLLGLYTTFLVLVTSSVLAALMLALYFRRLKWI
jgi:magnesium transporter